MYFDSLTYVCKSMIFFAMKQINKDFFTDWSLSCLALGAFSGRSHLTVLSEILSWNDFSTNKPERKSSCYYPSIWLTLCLASSSSSTTFSQEAIISGSAPTLVELPHPIKIKGGGTGNEWTGHFVQTLKTKLLLSS